MNREDELNGFAGWAARGLGFDEPCRDCGHENGLHEVDGRCAVLECKCVGFKARRAIDEQMQAQANPLCAECGALNEKEARAKCFDPECTFYPRDARK